ncbi:hypothetical protein NUU61_001259 [Penicillium alfredii]|uniref:Uncharacterized protein n=1 Tax=Penicillium alfredii TaxID=1506179 RepID=A0A9W9KRG3_9EURO|nr:uncharacterized protein NUU61_001259 [Penicillium alfredii]KAJ5115500.1 hypothetical protein NUU61_001259 [Penicillium alfredii]
MMLILKDLYLVKFSSKRGGAGDNAAGDLENTEICMLKTSDKASKGIREYLTAASDQPSPYDSINCTTAAY